MTQKVAIQGEQASFHDIAARQFFGQAAQILPAQSFKEVFKALGQGKASSGVCAIENSLFGSINETYDLLRHHDSQIVGEVYLRVEQCLIGLPGTKLADIAEVYSHPVALAQCDDYLDEHLPDAQRLEFHDTAAAVAFIKQQGSQAKAAIASRAAAQLHGLPVLASNIETNKHNYTRFVVIDRAGRVVPNANKTSLILETSHTPGALYHALGAFADQKLNISKLQSRPIVGRAWHYIFYADVEAAADDPAMVRALASLKKIDCQVSVLGSYKAGKK